MDLRKAYINQAILLVQHATDNRLRYRQEEAEKAFSSVMNVQSQQTNVPDDFDPNAARLLFQSSSKQLMLSKVAVQALLVFEDSDKNWKEQLGIIKKNFANISSKIPKFQEPTGGVSVILTFNVPSTMSRVEMSSTVVDRYLSVPRDDGDDVASGSFKVGFKTKDDLFYNYEIDVYEMKRFEVPFGSAPQEIDFSTLPVSEAGYSIKVDINNKPRTGNHKAYMEEFKDVFDSIELFMEEKLPRLTDF